MAKILTVSRKSHHPIETLFNLACYFFSSEMSIDRFPSIRFTIVSTDSTAMRKPYSISPMVSAKVSSL